MRLFISPEEHERRRTRVRAAFKQRGADALVLFSPTQIFYLLGFAVIATERPIMLVLTPETTTLFVPRLEEEHAHKYAPVDRVVAYPEYPTEKHPMARFADLLNGARLGRATIGADGDGYPGIMGYRGPRLSETMPSAKIMIMRDLIEDMITVKSSEEIELIRESCRWGNLAHRLLQEYTRPGVNESEVSQRASHEATMTMVRTLGPSYRPLSWTFPGAHAGYRGQIGANSAIPHAMTMNAVFQPGDVLVTGAASTVGGYLSELERTMIIAPVSSKQRRYFDLMMGAQDAAFAAIKPGRPCSDVDRAVRAFMKKHNLMSTWRHHVGHALGMGGHEAPFFDIGDDTIMRPGMVFSVEPGIYLSGFAGFRHSDTIAVTETGMDMLTYYPRDLASLTIA
jgi:Xaa-Pro aminopeptidase